MMELEKLELEDLTNGFCLEGGAYRCLYCQAAFEVGEVFALDERFVDAPKAARLHLERAHGSPFHALLGQGKKTTGVTDAQARLMGDFYAQAPDRQIAREAGVSPSTVRFQRHALREKAKQAKVFLALARMMEERIRTGGAQLLPVHESAKMVDERYMVTQDEAEAILRASFSSMAPLKLKHFSSKEKKKLVALRVIAQQFEPGVRYSGKQVDEALKAIYEDHATLRRYLIEYGFMERTADGREYWRL